MFQDEQIPLGGRCHVICAYPRLDRLSAFLNLYIWSYLFAGFPFEWLVQAIHGLESMYPFTVEASWNRTGSYAQSVIGTVLFL